MKTLPQQSWRSALSFLTKVLCALSICVSSTQVWSKPVSFTSTQYKYISAVSQYTDDPKIVSIVQAIMYVETNAGITNRSNGNCHGIMQINTNTAIDILEDHQDIAATWNVNYRSYRDVTHKLINFPLFGIELAVAHITDLIHETSSNDRAILAYNVGEDAAVHTKYVHTRYVKKVHKWMDRFANISVEQVRADKLQY